MTLSVLIIVMTGLLAGSLHVLTGPDHLAAIAPFTADKPSRSWRIGLWWGIGHTASIWLIGALVFLTREFLPIEPLSHWSEVIVGVILIGLGIWGIRKAMRTRMHYHIHEHNGHAHAHFHVHDKHSDAHHKSHQDHQHIHAPLGIGIVHGLAGSSHFWVSCPGWRLPLWLSQWRISEASGLVRSSRLSSFRTCWEGWCGTSTTGQPMHTAGCRSDSHLWPS